MDLITYETIRAVHREEREDQLQELPKDFYVAVRDWLNRKHSQKDTSSVLEFENARKLLEDIVNRRERKIILSALRTIRGDLPPKNLTDFEQVFFDQIVNMLKTYRQNINEKLLGYDTIVEEKMEEVKKSLEEMKKEEAPKDKTMVKVLTDLPRFVGSNMQYYGPLKTGDVITLPNEIADLLLKRKVAEKFLE